MWSFIQLFIVGSSALDLKGDDNTSNRWSSRPTPDCPCHRRILASLSQIFMHGGDWLHLNSSSLLLLLDVVPFHHLPRREQYQTPMLIGKEPYPVHEQMRNHHNHVTWPILLPHYIVIWPYYQILISEVSCHNHHHCVSILLISMGSDGAHDYHCTSNKALDCRFVHGRHTRGRSCMLW